MNNEMLKTAMILCTGITFCSALIAGGFAVGAANVWLKNRREERDARDERARNRDSHERETWTQLLADRDARIDSMHDEIVRLTRLYEFSSALLDESETRRLKKEDAE